MTSLNSTSNVRITVVDFGQNNFADDHLCEDLFGARNDIGNFRSQARWTGITILIIIECHLIVLA